MWKEQMLITLAVMGLLVLLLGASSLTTAIAETQHQVALPLVMMNQLQEPAEHSIESTREPEPLQVELPCKVSKDFPNKVYRWCGLITLYADKFGLDPDLIAALIKVESNGRPGAYSKSGAVGLMQVMPRDGIATKFGDMFAKRPTIKQLKDPEFNIKYGTRMLARLVEKYGLREGLKRYGPSNYGYRYADLVLSVRNEYGR